LKIYIKDHKTIAQREKREQDKESKDQEKGKVRVDEQTGREV
jgi:hypothetical protein